MGIIEILTPMVEFALNSSISKSTGFTPFELMYGYIPKTIQTIGESEFAGVQDFADNARDLVIRAHDQGCPRVILWVSKKWLVDSLAHNALIESCVGQIHHANARCQPDDPQLEIGQHIYLS
jgi:hypothetical protein